jgi:chromosome segregation ATPase
VSPTEYQQLVEFLGQQFTAIDRRFTGLETRLDDLRRQMLGHFDEIYDRLERLEQEYQAITQALRRIEAGLSDERRRREIIERDLAELKRYAATLQARIEELEQRLGN